MWAREDAFHFAAKKKSGDFIMTCSLKLLGNGVEAHRKAGLILRSSLDASASYADIAVHGDGLTALQYRPADGAETFSVPSALKAPEKIQLERKGSTIIARAAARGSSLEEVGRIDIGLPGEAHAGLFLCSHNAEIVETAVFGNLRIDVPAKDGVNGYADPPRSRMEIVDAGTGERKVLFSSEENFEAPNWSLDGKYLLFNKKGYLYRYLFSDGSIVRIDTGAAVKNNNDHGISPDGKTLIVSNHDDDRKSRIYAVPISGGPARLVTPLGPSYWHGISPDGRTLVYCAERGGVYNIWGIPFGGGDEFRLTDSPSKDDGPEFSPDGTWIYFNSTRSGRMKIWRMAAAGEKPGAASEQITFGETNDWFAHLSPDGGKMAYLSYPDTVPADSHPHNERVSIRLMDLAARKSSILVDLYGGQGTFNVPSWSPDGRFVAFVSYTYGDPEE